jgi:hypothetical protein
LYIKFSGKASSLWRTYNGKNSRFHEGKDVYLDQKTYLFGCEGSPSTEVAAGIHTYNFEIQLPAGLPPSMELNHGYIRYYIESCLDIPWRFDKEIKVAFQVVRKFNFSEFPDMKAQKTLEKQISTKGCFSWFSVPLNASVSIPQSVIAPGAEMPITIQLDNKSNKKIGKIHISLNQVIKYNR